MTAAMDNSASSPASVFRFLNCRSGNVAMIMALAALPAAMIVGAMMDQAAYNDAVARYQSALDAATLDAALGSTNAERQARFNSVFQAQLGSHNVPGRIDAPTLEQASDGSISTTVSGQVSRKFLNLAGAGPMQVSVKSAAARAFASTPTAAIFKMRVSKGWFWKRLNLFVVDANGVTSKVAEWVYQPFNQAYSFSPSQIASLSWPMSAAFSKNGSSANGVGTMSGPTDAVSLGQDYKKAYLTMEVSGEGCAPNQTLDTSRSYAVYGSSYPYNPIYCKARTGADSTDVWTFSTDDAAGVAHMIRYGKDASGNPDGNQRTQYASAQPIQILIPCSADPTEAYYGWEDSTGSGAPSSDPVSNWYTQDFVFSVKAAKCETNKNAQSAMVRLLR